MYNKNFSKDPTEKQKLGAIGEDAVCEYLKKQGFSITDRNYLKKWGELDIVAKRDKKIHFVEVKSVSRDLSVTHVTKNSLGSIIMNAVRGGSENKRGHVQEYVDEGIFTSNKEMRQNNDSYNPEDNMHPWKLKRLARAVQSYLLEKDVPEDVEWQFDLATVLTDTNKGRCEVSILEDIVL